MRLVARGMGRACVSGASDIQSILKNRWYILVKQNCRQMILLLLMAVQEFYLGKVDMVQPSLSGAFETIMGWADPLRRMAVVPTQKHQMMPRWRVILGLKVLGYAGQNICFSMRIELSPCAR